MNRPRAIGTAAETAVVRQLHTHGFPHAERRALHGANDRGDITGTPGITWSVKGGAAARTASDQQIIEWLRGAERMRAINHDDLAVLITARNGYGAPRADHWNAWINVYTLTRILGNHERPIPEDTRTPVRIRLADLCGLLNRHGWGNT